MSALNPRQMFLLDEACHPIAEVFGHHIYLVGTAAARSYYRDVDVRLILPDKKHDQITRVIGVLGVTFLGLAIGEYLASRTSLAIDFQIQRRTEANVLHAEKPRNPLGARDLLNYRGDAQTVDMERKIAKLREENPSDLLATPGVRDAPPPRTVGMDHVKLADRQGDRLDPDESRKEP